MGSFPSVNQQESKQKRSHRTMRSFIILGALSALSRGAELPATVGGAARDDYYKYVTTASGTGQTDTITAFPDDAAGSWTSGSCAATSNQSPIDIVTSSAKEESTNPGEIMLIGFEVKMTGSVINDGRQIYFTPDSSLTWSKPILYGGALSYSKSYVFDRFILLQIHHLHGANQFSTVELFHTANHTYLTDLFYSRFITYMEQTNSLRWSSFIQQIIRI